MDIQRAIVTVIVWGLVSATASTALAQARASGPATSSRQGRSTVILQFETSNVSQEIMDTFYLSLNDMINAHAGMHVVSGGEVTIEELSVTVGCNSLDPECLSSLQEYVGAERMVFGSVQRSGDVHLFTLELYDFTEDRFVRKLHDRTIEGDRAILKEAIPAVVENFLYGNVGRLEVAVENGKHPRVYFDGEKMGPAPLQLNKLPLGQHAVTVETADGRKKTQFVMLRKDERQTIEFQFEDQRPRASSQGPPAAGLSVAGVGLAGLAIGLAGSAQNAKFRNQAQAMTCANGAHACSPSGENLSSEEVAAHARQTDRKVRSSATMSTIGYSVAAAGLGIGGYLIYRHYTGRSGTERKPRVAETLRVAPSPDGVHVGLSVDF